MSAREREREGVTICSLYCIQSYLARSTFAARHGNVANVAGNRSVRRAERCDPAWSRDPWCSAHSKIPPAHSSMEQVPPVVRTCTLPTHLHCASATCPCCKAPWCAVHSICHPWASRACPRCTAADAGSCPSDCPLCKGLARLKVIPAAFPTHLLACSGMG